MLTVPSARGFVGAGAGLPPVWATAGQLSGADGSSGQNVTLFTAIPADAQVGDLLLIIAADYLVWNPTQGGGITVPFGFTELLSGTARQFASMSWKICTAGDIGSFPHMLVTNSDNGKLWARTLVYRGVNQAAPIEGFQVAASASSSTTFQTVPTLVASGDARLVLNIGIVGIVNQAYNTQVGVLTTTGIGWTERVLANQTNPPGPIINISNQLNQTGAGYYGEYADLYEKRVDGGQLVGGSTVTATGSYSGQMTVMAATLALAPAS